ncbi:MAG: hypothetical protein GY792_03625, partial [Gammaproteobacteria bacterium]|nr:hypothetical protein [Gammaproteobacteria bacterium]
MQQTESNQSSGVENSAVRKGVIPKLLGVVAIILGFLDSMLSWRGGFDTEPFYIALIAGGVVLYIVGSLANGR